LPDGSEIAIVKHEHSIIGQSDTIITRKAIEA